MIVLFYDVLPDSMSYYRVLAEHAARVGVTTSVLFKCPNKVGLKNLSRMLLVKDVVELARGLPEGASRFKKRRSAENLVT